MADLLSELNDIELDVYDLMRMAQLTRDRLGDIFVGPNSNGMLIVDRQNHDVMEFACRDVAGRAEILLDRMRAVTGELEEGPAEDQTEGGEHHGR